ncbi:hypothetical protein AMAG_14819 [Allomyces macrogynus ATCC 38327]|uniref:Uncharacterized protein n=1 Tax=Allomyces macrogynus (strain ATCC 38327) TaxID=578462 RepID=A0A0L0T5D1_ALLM3|nr:hypothetical protein AMAG_14819 [Allomyces macrogynus ATCC 38327]|eukprot:KNE69983.1 hypothetical protein AMAG_14819 [Allomyces macrogynus ATCC 38327]
MAAPADPAPLPPPELVEPVDDPAATVDLTSAPAAPPLVTAFLTVAKPAQYVDPVVDRILRHRDTADALVDMFKDLAQVHDAFGKAVTRTLQKHAPDDDDSVLSPPITALRALLQHNAAHATAITSALAAQAERVKMAAHAAQKRAGKVAQNLELAETKDEAVAKKKPNAKKVDKANEKLAAARGAWEAECRASFPAACNTASALIAATTAAMNAVAKAHRHSAETMTALCAGVHDATGKTVEQVVVADLCALVSPDAPKLRVPQGGVKRGWSMSRRGTAVAGATSLPRKDDGDVETPDSAHAPSTASPIHQVDADGFAVRPADAARAPVVTPGFDSDSDDDMAAARGPGRLKIEIQARPPPPPASDAPIEPTSVATAMPPPALPERRPTAEGSPPPDLPARRSPDPGSIDAAVFAGQDTLAPLPPSLAGTVGRAAPAPTCDDAILPSFMTGGVTSDATGAPRRGRLGRGSVAVGLSTVPVPAPPRDTGSAASQPVAILEEVGSAPAAPALYPAVDLREVNLLGSLSDAGLPAAMSAMRPAMSAAYAPPPASSATTGVGDLLSSFSTDAPAAAGAAVPAAMMPSLVPTAHLVSTALPLPSTASPMPSAASPPPTTPPPPAPSSSSTSTSPHPILTDPLASLVSFPTSRPTPPAPVGDLVIQELIKTLIVNGKLVKAMIMGQITFSPTSTATPLHLKLTNPRGWILRDFGTHPESSATEMTATIQAGGVLCRYVGTAPASTTMPAADWCPLHVALDAAWCGADTVRANVVLRPAASAVFAIQDVTVTCGAAIKNVVENPDVAAVGASALVWPAVPVGAKREVVWKALGAQYVEVQVRFAMNAALGGMSVTAVESGAVVPVRSAALQANLYAVRVKLPAPALAPAHESMAGPVMMGVGTTGTVGPATVQQGAVTSGVQADLLGLF